MGEVIYIDRFGNLITNITRKIFTNFVKGSGFKICLADQQINKISHSYQENEESLALAIFDSFDNLEIAVGQASAKEFLSVEKGAPIQVIKCHNKS